MYMKKRIIIAMCILWLFAVLLVGQIISDLVKLSLRSSKLKTEYGTIVRQTESGYEKWGLEVKKGRIIKHKEVLFFSDADLPERLKKEGLKVRATYIMENIELISSDMVAP